MRTPRSLAAGASFATALLATACADQAPTSPTAVSPTLVTAPAGPMCETATFSQYSHGNYVTSVTFPSFNLAVTATAFSDALGAVPGQARAFSTDHISTSPNEGTDMEWNGAYARCPGCEGLGTLLVVQRLGTSAVLDNNPGGILTLSGFPSAGEFYVKSFTSVDDDLTEPPMRLLVDGVQVAQSTPMGDGSVQTVTAGSTPAIVSSISFVLGTAARNDGLASGGVDNITLCQRVGGGCTRTIGYWKTHAGFGPQADVLTQHLPLWLGTAGGSASTQVTTAAQAVSILSQSQGPSNGIVKLRAQLLAAKLNLASGAATAADLWTNIALADAFLATHAVASWSSLSAAQKAQVLAWQAFFEGYNSGPLHCD